MIIKSAILLLTLVDFVFDVYDKAAQGASKIGSFFSAKPKPITVQKTAYLA